MDSSTRQAYILGNLRVSRNELTAEDWSAVLRHVHESCVTHLKYFSGFKSFKDLSNWSLSEYYRRSTPDKAVYPVELLSSTDRFIELCVVISDTDQAISGRKRVTNDILVLSMKGSWYLWESTYECHVEHLQGIRMHRTKTKEIATTSVFTELTWPKGIDDFIVDMLKKGKASNLQYIIERFSEILTGTIRDAQIRLNGMTAKNGEILRMLGCFDE